MISKGGAPGKEACRLFGEGGRWATLVMVGLRSQPGGEAARERKIIACLRENQLVLSIKRAMTLREMKVHLTQLRLH